MSTPPHSFVSEIAEADLKGDCSRLNRVITYLMSQVGSAAQAIQTIQNVVTVIGSSEPQNQRKIYSHDKQREDDGTVLAYPQDDNITFSLLTYSLVEKKKLIIVKADLGTDFFVIVYPPQGETFDDGSDSFTLYRPGDALMVEFHA